jgi:transposase
VIRVDAIWLATKPMSLIQSARINGHDLNAYLQDVLTRLPTQRASEVGELISHHWSDSP